MVELTPFQEFSVVTLYSRWLDDKKRRETWPEVVDRWYNFWVGKFDEWLQEKRIDKKKYVLLSDELKKAKEYTLDLKILPATRTLRTAGKALERDNLCAFACTYNSISTVRSFSEILYLLCAGCGCGFSVERKYTDKLPDVPKELFPTDTTIVVADSRLGWATSLHELLSLLYAGKVPKWDTSKIRPKGAILKTIGGRASGEGPLRDLFEFCVATFQKAKGRKLKPIECHDIITKIGDIVVSGGTRRSAQISLSDLSDTELRHAKSGNWHDLHPHRAFANNSAVFTEKPTMGDFMEEWLSLYRSGSGERGIFNLVSARATAPERRERELIVGTNPCQPGYATVIRKGLTGEGEDWITLGIEDLLLGDEIWCGDRWGTVVKKVCTGVKDVYQYATAEGVFIGTENHRVVCDGKKIEVAKASKIDGAPTPVEYQRGEIPEMGSPILRVIPLGKDLVYSITVDHPNHVYWTGGLLVSNCGEIVLRDMGLCNLANVIARQSDTLEDLLDKAQVATFVCTIQAALTNFKYVRDKWRQNADEEALLGVALSGCMDCTTLINGGRAALERLRDEVVASNKHWAEIIGVNPAAAATCIKPDGQTSQLCDCASGLHPRFAPYYLRAVMVDETDPVSKVLIEAGVPHERSIWSKTAWVFYFPCKSPDGVPTRNDFTAIQQLENWLTYKRHYTEHNPSVTISVKEHEWLEVGAWVYSHFDEVSGLSFLPYSDHSYKQAPFQEITKEEYEKRVVEMPVIDWARLSHYETEDMTTSGREISCMNGQCEL